MQEIKSLILRFKIESLILMILPKKLLFLLFFLISFRGNAQQFFTSSEYGLTVGASTYFGDLNPNYGMHSIRPAAGAFYRYAFNPYIAVKAMANYTKVGYDDQFSSNEFQKQRNLNFKSDILEAAVTAEFNFFWFATGETNHRFTPYLAFGVGAFYYEPYTYYNGDKYKLRKLGTEGQNTKEFSDRKYKPYSVCFPVGAGIKYWVKPGLNIGVELLNRFTLTDYLDDVSNTYIGSEKFNSDPMHPSVSSVLQDPSFLNPEGQKLGRAGKQRGDNSTKDQYLMLQFSLSFQLKTYKCPPGQSGEWQ